VSPLENAASTERIVLRGMAGYRSLSKHSGVPLNKVLQHAANGTLRALLSLETRGRTREARSSRSGGLDPKQCLLELWSKREL
jgi:hypothetical protein